MDFFLSSKFLEHIKRAGIEDDFEIKIFDQSIYCNTFVALLVSNEITNLYRIDRTARKFNMKFSPISAFYDNISELKQMISRTNFVNIFTQFLEGQPIHFNQNTNNNLSDDIAKLTVEFGKILGNSEMIDKGLKQLKINLNEENDSIESVIKSIKIHQRIQLGQITQQQYDVISSNFYTIFNKGNEAIKNELISVLKNMDQNELGFIFSSNKLRIESEDSLFEFITSLGKDFYFLYDFIEVQFLSVEKVKKLIENIQNYELPFHRLLWNSICRRLLFDITSINRNKNQRLQTNLKTNSNPKSTSESIDCEKGILKFLQQSSFDNVYLSETIDVKTSTINYGSIKNLFDQSKDTALKVKDDKNSYIIIDFKDKKVNVKSYYLSVPAKNYSGSRPKTWVIEGSNNFINWQPIDFQKDNNQLASYGASNVFTCQNQNDNFYRFVRIRELISQDSTHMLLLSEIEFYGSIILG